MLLFLLIFYYNKYFYLLNFIIQNSFNISYLNTYHSSNPYKLIKAFYDNSQEHVINDCAKTEKLRAKLKKELNDLDPTTKNKTLLESIFYWYYSKDLSNKKGDNKGVRLIKKFVFKIYKLMKETSAEEKQDT